MDRKQLLISVFLSVAFAAMCRPAIAGVSVTGRVIDPHNHRPVAGFVVAVYRQGAPQPLSRTVSLENGTYVLRLPAPGEYYVAASGGKSIFPWKRLVVVPVGGLSGVDLQATSGEPSFTLQLKGPASTYPSEPIDLDLNFRTFEQSFSGSQTANLTSDGKLTTRLPDWMVSSLRLLPPNALGPARYLHVNVRVPGVGYGEVESHSWPIAPLDVAMYPGHTLHGRVRNASGQAAVGVDIRINAVVVGDREIPVGEIDLKADALGQFDVSALPPANYYVEVMIPGAGPHHRIVSVFSDAHVTITPVDP